jgi:hypothetical protein
MGKSDEQASELVRCAAAVERELRRLEELSRSARNIRLSSEKNIARAARGLQQALEQQERLAQELRGLGQAMLGMQTRQEGAMNPLGARAAEIQARMARLTEHMQQFESLGTKAGETAAALRDIAAPSGAASSAEGASALMEADEQVQGLAEEARRVAEAAAAEEFPDIAREAHALGQRVHAMREHLAELLRAKSIGAS